jgi:predicted dehydrogenase
MVERVKVAIVGCGGMGRRHLAGLAELTRYGVQSVDLVAVVDGATARQAVVLVYALFESALAGRPVIIAEVEIDEHYGWLA